MFNALAAIGAAVVAIPIATASLSIGFTGVAALAGALCMLSLIPSY